jgi:hypothetical protein
MGVDDSNQSKPLKGCWILSSVTTFDTARFFNCENTEGGASYNTISYPLIMENGFSPVQVGLARNTRKSTNLGIRFTIPARLDLSGAGSVSTSVFSTGHISTSIKSRRDRGVPSWRRYQMPVYRLCASFRWCLQYSCA